RPILTGGSGLGLSVAGRRVAVPAMRVTPLVRLASKALVLLAALAAVGFFGLLGGLWVEHRREISLPDPSGPLPVGRTTQDWTDEAALDPLAPVRGTHREVLAWIWYPAVSRPSTAIADYMPPLPPAEAERDRPT